MSQYSSFTKTLMAGWLCIVRKSYHMNLDVRKEQMLPFSRKGQQ